VIHRDIKPENILLHNGRPMVMDFGIALALSAAAGGRMTETGLSLGTPHYMSPEQATADRDITGRSDIYSLGSVLYEMLTGEPPHMGTSAQQIIMKIVTEEAAPVTKLRKSVPPNVAAAVAIALEKLPADRFHDAASFAAALHDPAFRVARAAAVDDAPTGREWSRHHLVVVGAVAVAALVVGATAASLIPGSRSSTVPPRRVALAFPGGSRPASLGHTLDLAPNGRGLLFLGRDSSIASRPQFWFRDWNRLDVESVVGTLPDGCCPSYSPSGDSVAYLTRPNWLHVAPLRGGAPSRVTDADLVDVGLLGGGVGWGHDGWLYASARTGLVRMTPAGDSVEQVTRYEGSPGEAVHLWPSLLPDGRGVVFTSVSRLLSRQLVASISVVDLRSGATSTLAQGVRAVVAPTGHLVVAKADGVLWAAPFDSRSLRLAGPERELADTVSVSGRTANFAISPTGTLAYTRPSPETSQRMVWVGRAGETSPVELTGLGSSASGSTPDGPMRFRTPRLSPDGRQVAATVTNGDRNESLTFSMDLAPQRVGFGDRLQLNPAWRPTRGSLSFITLDSTLAIYEAPASGAPPRRLDFGERRGIRDQTWSPDGVWLVYRTDDQDEGNGDILAVRPGLDTVPRVIAGSAAEELSPSVSPDNRWIAYSSNKSGRHEVYVAPFPDPARIERPVSLNGGRHPAWNPQGGELFYVDASDNMVAVSVPPGPTFSPGAQRVLFSVADFVLQPFDRSYDLSPDGARFLMIQGGRAPTQIVVVFGFDEELRRRMAAP
jgi:serine/threonine-protein kinase